MADDLKQPGEEKIPATEFYLSARKYLVQVDEHGHPEAYPRLIEASANNPVKVRLPEYFYRKVKNKQTGEVTYVKQETGHSDPTLTKVKPPKPKPGHPALEKGVAGLPKTLDDAMAAKKAKGKRAADQ